MAFNTILMEKKDGVARVTLNRPEVLNALSPLSLSELIAALKEIDGDDSVRVVVLKGAGRCFCAGLDLKIVGGLLEEGNEEAARSQLIDQGLEVGEVIDGLSKPVIAAVHGYAITGGFYLAYCCDIVIASEEAVFQDTHARWGFVPGWQESQRLLRLVGIPKAKYIFFTSDQMSAGEMEAAGLVSKVVPTGKLDEAVDELIAKLLKQSPASLAILKVQLSRGMKTDWLTATKIDERIRKGLFADFITEDSQRLLKGFRDKTARA